MEESKVCHGFAEKGRCRFGERCRFEHVGSPPKKPRSKVRFLSWSSFNYVTEAARRQTKKKSHKGRREPHRDSADHIAEFFAQYPTYQYNPARSFMDEYYAMCDFFCWDKESKERKRARERLRDAMVKQFNNVYGTDVDDLEAWQSLCRALELDPIPSKLRTCRTVSMARHSLLPLFVEHPHPGHQGCPCQHM